MINNQVAGSQRTGDDIDIVGRDEQLCGHIERILSAPGSVGIIYGSSGVGKSAFSHRLNNVLNSDNHPEIDAVFFDIEVAQAAAEPFLNLHDRIFDEVRPRGMARARQLLNENPLTNGIKLAKGLTRDFFEKYAGGLQHTTDALSDIAADSAALVSQNNLRKQVEGSSNYSRLIDALLAAAARSSKTYVLVLDGMELASEETIILVDSMSRRLPENIHLQLVINSEDPAFSSSNFVALKSRLQRHNMDGIFELPGLTSEDIVDWKRQSTGVTIPIKVAEQARDDSDGRPVLLRPWIESEDQDFERIASKYGQFYGYYNERFDSLTNEAKDIGRLLAVAYPHALAVRLLMMASEFTHGDIATAIDDLNQNGFSEETQEGFRCKHTMIAEFLKLMMGQSLIKDYKQNIFSALSSSGRTEAVFAPSRRDALEADVVTEAAGVEGLNFLLGFTRRILKLGAYQQAQAKLDAIDNLLSSGVTATDDERAEAVLLRAEVLSQLGQYRQALVILNAASILHTTDTLSDKLLLAKGEAYFRLNQYVKTVQQLKQVRVNASAREDVNLWAQSIVRLAGVTMDVGKWAAARQIGNVLMDKVLPKVTAIDDQSMQCHILRTVARIHAPEDSRKAEYLIDNAVRLARKIDSERVLGNCFFALGEVLRHDGRNSEANESYGRALKIGQDTGNKDLAVYSLMGILVLSLINSDMHLFESLVDHLRDTIDYDAPVELANANLFFVIRDYLGGKEIPGETWDSLKSEFMRLRRHWQIRLVDSIQNTRNLTINQVSTEIQSLQIVF